MTVGFDTPSPGGSGYSTNDCSLVERVSGPLAFIEHMFDHG